MEAGEAAAEAFAKREAAKLTDNWSNWPIALVPLSVVGLLQYVAPSLQLLIGVLVFKEAFDATRAVGFAAIWAGLVIFASDGLWRAQTPQAFRRAASSPCCSVVSSCSRMRRRSVSRARWVPESMRGKPAAPADAPPWCIGDGAAAGRGSPLPPGTDDTAWSRDRVVQPFPGARLLV